MNWRRFNSSNCIRSPCGSVGVFPDRRS
jgi:hypothetical protein